MNASAQIRGAAKAPAPDAEEVRLSRAARRRARRERCAELVAVGAHVPGQPRSHFQTAELRDVVQGEIKEQRAMMEAQRKLSVDPNWDFDVELARKERDR